MIEIHDKRSQTGCLLETWVGKERLVSFPLGLGLACFVILCAMFKLCVVQEMGRPKPIYHCYLLDAKLSDDFFVFLGDFFVVFVRLLGLRGQAGAREGRREGGGWIFPRKTLIPAHF